MTDYENDYRVEQRKRLALQSTLVRIKDLEDSEIGEPLDEAISLAKKALDALGDPVAEGNLIAPEGADRCTICGFVVDLRYEAIKPTISFGMAGRAPRRADLDAKPSSPTQEVNARLLEALRELSAASKYYAETQKYHRNDGERVANSATRLYNAYTCTDALVATASRPQPVEAKRT